MKFCFYKYLSKPIILTFSFISFIPVHGDTFNPGNLNAEYLFEESLMDSSTKNQDDNSSLPTNPFEIVEMMRRYNSLNDSTSPSDALDDALKSFYGLEEK